MLLGELNEIIVYAKDMRAMVAFYRDQLGLSIAWPAGLDDYGAEMWVALQTGACTLALHGGLDKTAAEQEPRAQPRFGFAVGDIHAVRAALLERGVACGEVRNAAPGVHVCDLRDCEGNGLFIEQREH